MGFSGASSEAVMRVSCERAPDQRSAPNRAAAGPFDSLGKSPEPEVLKASSLAIGPVAEGGQRLFDRSLAWTGPGGGPPRWPDTQRSWSRGDPTGPPSRQCPDSRTPEYASL